MTQPLGILSHAPAAVETQLRALEEYDFTPINTDLARKMEWSSEKCRSIELRTKQYLALSLLNPADVHAPAQDVDLYWHQMIMRTKWYAEFCQAVFGFFVHHNPEPTVDGKPRSVIRQTGALLKGWFGERGGVGPLAQCNNENCNNENCNNENCNNENCNNENCNNDARKLAKDTTLTKALIKLKGDV